MKKPRKIASVVNSLTSSIELWKDHLHEAWKNGKREGYGFPVGTEYDTPSEALLNDGYELVGEIDDIAVGTNSINSIVVVKSIYGPWAVDVTETLIDTVSTSAFELEEVYQAV
ncbi:MAG: hypothetical protein JNN15_11435 [Blastocatellia bacterium]|nr:hypothetical protein [Blastocatellia bacterium]